MKISIRQKAISAALLLSPVAINATPIDVAIVGEGSISVKETNTECNESCEINNDLDTNTLVPQSASGWRFSHWSGATCDAGNGLLISGDLHPINSGQDGAKTLTNADFDGDGDIDLVSIGLNDGSVNLLTNDGSGDFSSTRLMENLEYPSSLASYDWNNDGFTDLLVSDYQQGSIFVLLNDGNGVLSVANQLFLPGALPYAITVYDENGDNSPDILVSSFNADTSGNLGQLVNSISNPRTFWYHNDGGDTFTRGPQLSDQAAITLDSGFDPVSNNLVVVAAEIVGEGIVVYENGLKYVAQSSESAYGAALGDVDNNGTLDILAAHYEPSQLNLISRNRDATITIGAPIGTPSEGVTATTIADLDGDGLQDFATAQFNLDAFYYHNTQSYVECVINNNHQLNLTANFTQGEGPTTPSNPTPTNPTPTNPTPTPPAPAPTPEPPVIAPDNNSSGGGSVDAALLFTLVLCLSRRIFRNK